MASSSFHLYRSDYAPGILPGGCGALIAAVDDGSPAQRAGLVPGMTIIAVDGQPLRDIIDWLWLSDNDEVELSTTTTAFSLQRAFGESWGISFSDVLFDGLRTCCNSCIFCFMSMLPPGMRSSLYVRDDDYRLSFLQGNFVTLTNMNDEDVQRVIEYRLSPLHVSLHAIDPALRQKLIGKNHARGIEVLEQLLAAGIEMHIQIVLVPGHNDDEQLDATLSWIEERSGIRSVGIVPYGFTGYAGLQDSFDPHEASALIAQVAPYQQRSLAADGTTRFQLADEWFLKAGAPIPPAEYYDDYPQFEDGIGMLRSFIDDYKVYWEDMLSENLTATDSGADGDGDDRWMEDSVEDRTAADGRLCENVAELTTSCHPERKRRILDKTGADKTGDGSLSYHLEQDDKTRNRPLSYPDPPSSASTLLVTGEAFAPTLRELTRRLPVEVVAIRNDFFKGNVDVAGLLTARDIISQLTTRGLSPNARVLIPDVLFNAEGFTLDDKRAEDIAQALNCEVIVVPCRR